VPIPALNSQPLTLNSPLIHGERRRESKISHEWTTPAESGEGKRLDAAPDHIPKSEPRANPLSATCDSQSDPVAGSPKVCAARTRGCSLASLRAWGSRARNSRPQKRRDEVLKKQNQVCQRPADFDASL